MRIHIVLDDDLVARIDERAGERKRSEFIENIVREAIESERRWDQIDAALGSLKFSEHDWDSDAAAWVQSQRSDTGRTG